MNTSGVQQQVSSGQVRVVNSLTNAVVIPASSIVTVSSAQQKVLQPLQTAYSGQPLILTLANHNGEEVKNCDTTGRVQQVIYQPQQNYSEYAQYNSSTGTFYQTGSSSNLSSQGVAATQVITQGGENYIIHSGSLDANGQIAHTIRASPATVGWLLENYENAESVSLPRSTLYNHYIRHCTENKLDPMNPASFGKLIRSVFPGLRTRRLGTRGNSQYHYYGIRIKSMSTLNQLGCDGLMSSRQQTIHQAKRFKADGEDGNVSTSDSSQPSQPAASSVVNSQQQQHLQYLGDTSAALPDFGHVMFAVGQTLPVGITMDHVALFEQTYRDHCEAFMEIVINLQFSLVETLWMSFWRKVHTNLDGGESDRQLSNDKLYALCELGAVQQYIQQADYSFYQAIVRILIPDVLRPIPSQLTQAIRNFAKNLESWLKNAMSGAPDEILKIKVNAVRAFAQILRRYTSLNHLAQAARAVLQNSNQISQMLSDINKVDFTSVQEQASWVCHCDDNIVRHLEQDFKRTLQQQTPLEQWASWLEDVVNEALAPYASGPSSDFPKAARQFLLKWSFYSSMVIRDLTLRSAASFGSFHLIRLLYDEYMFYLVEHKVAAALGETSISVMAEFRQMIDIGACAMTCDSYGNDVGLGTSDELRETAAAGASHAAATAASGSYTTLTAAATNVPTNASSHDNNAPYLAMSVQSEVSRSDASM